MNKEQLKSVLNNKYNREDWQNLLRDIFNGVTFFASPKPIPVPKEEIKEFYHIGNVRLNDGKSLAIFELEVSDKIKLNRNKVALNNIISKYIDQESHHGVLALFDSSSNNYRFTFTAKDSQITEKGFETKITDSKRFTYVFGPKETCRTATDRFFQLAEKKSTAIISDVEEAFSVEKLNKEFFNKYKEQYNKFVSYISQSLTTDEKLKNIFHNEDKIVRDFVQKTLGRIVFLYFLQKKGWMGCPKEREDWKDGDPNFLQNQFENYSDKTHFHSKFLVPLYFDCLNQKRENDIFEITVSRIPYLNGGLFEKDKIDSKLLDLPTEYWKNLFDFFGQYNFTIDENDPFDQEVGIDPEMLGNIFENLLEGNKDKGAFYTPKPIVDYMCKESLIQYLKTHLLDDNSNSNESLSINSKKNSNFNDIENFIRNHNIGNEEDSSNYISINSIKIENLLDKVKICDPAIGSGAFPMGILKEIFWAKMTLNIKHNPAEVKKQIIQNSIYGVDIDGGAIDIARLRFWLSLIVDSEKPEPLPNLDYKIMQGNSLLESFKGIDLSQIGSGNDLTVIEKEQDLFGYISEDQMSLTVTKTDLKKEIQNLIKDYFSIVDIDKKKSVKQKINSKIHEHLDFNLELKELQLQRFIAEAGNPENIINLNTKKRLKKKIEKWKEEAEEIKFRRKELHTLQNKNEKPYFLWHLFFVDVFDAGGFDIMIGNPPYIQLQKMGKETDILQAEKFETFTRSGDIYMLFYEKGINLIRKNGVLAYITSNSWMKTKYGKLLRKYFIEKTNPLKLLNFEDTLLFPAATVEANILITKKEQNAAKTLGGAIKQDVQKQSINKYFDKNKIELNNLDESEWIILSKEDYFVKSLIEQNTIEFSDLKVHLYIGLLIGLNEAFILSVKEREDLIKLNPKSDKILKPLLRGRDIKKFSFSFEDQWLILAHNGIKKLRINKIDIINDYPEIFEHLKQYKERLIIRHNQGDHWTNMRNCAYLKEFEKPKIVWGEISDKPKFCYDETGIYLNDRCSFMVGEDLKLLVGILNSNLIEWYFNLISTSSGMGTNMWKHYKIKKLPIPQISNDKRKQFEILSDYFTFINDSEISYLFEDISDDIISRFFEEVLNMMVYELYFEEHMKENKIDVLQFVDFENISHLETIAEKQDVIQKEFYKLKEKDNPIRNRILLSSTRSPNIIKRINESTH